MGLATGPCWRSAGAIVLRQEDLDPVRAGALAAGVVAGDPLAAHDFIALLWPHCVRLAAASPVLRRLANRDDLAHDVATRLVEKLGSPGSPQLASFFEWQRAHTDKQIDDWLRIVITNASRDAARRDRRQVLGSAHDPDAPSVKRFLNEFGAAALPPEIATLPRMTPAQTARQVLAYARAHLAEQPLACLGLWIEGRDFDEIAREVGLASDEDARKSLRAAVATLRRKFAEPA